MPDQDLQDAPLAGLPGGDGELSAVEVAMATCAAPAYFPSVRIGHHVYADGGLYAVAPDQIALHELEHFVHVDPGRVSMLSIGTATAHYRPAAGVREDTGAVGWLTDGRLVLTMISVQQQHVRAMLEDRLADRYLHLDADWPPEAALGIDVAKAAAAAALRGLARRTLRQADTDRLDAMLSPSA